MTPDESTVAEFLRRIGHPVALVGLGRIKGGPPNIAVVWPCEQNNDPVDHACGLSREYKSVYANLNPLQSYMLTFAPAVVDGETISVRNAMIARRAHVLIDVDAHGVPKELAREQTNAIKAKLGPPLIESDSGNGYGLIYTCNLPNDYESDQRVKSYLDQLETEFSCVDASVHTAGRLTRVIGTLNKSKITGERIPTLILN